MNEVGEVAVAAEEALFCPNEETMKANAAVTCEYSASCSLDDLSRWCLTWLCYLDDAS